MIEETNYELNFAPTFSEVNMANKLLNCTYIKSTKPNLGRQQLEQLAHYFEDYNTNHVAFSWMISFYDRLPTFECFDHFFLACLVA